MPHDATPQQVPTRNLTLVAKKQPLIATSWVAPVVLLDGYRFQLAWGPNILTIPADRPVHVQCEMPFIYTYGRAVALLQPNHLPELEYSPPATQWFAGEIGAAGTTKTNGTWLVWAMLGVLGAIVLLGIGTVALTAVLG
jgi:hypothetical protein